MATQQGLESAPSAAARAHATASSLRHAVETTGRYKVVFETDVPTADAISLLRRSTGISAVDAREFGDAPITTTQSEGVLFDEIGVAIVAIDPDQTRSLALAAQERPQRQVIVSPELVLYATGALPIAGGPEYLRGFRDGMDFALGGAPSASAAVSRVPLPPVAAETAFTWGLQITGAARRAYTGHGVRLAVLDTGIGTASPDWAGRAIVTASFVPGETGNDSHGHGTHCAGTAAGSLHPAGDLAYGVACAAELFAGQVLSCATGKGEEGWILQGISWALRNNCDVISMSLGAWVPRGYPFDPGFEQIARRALRRGAVIVAAAGNDSDRASGHVEPVNHPANCPSVMAVGALSLVQDGVSPLVRVSDFSNAGLDPNSLVDIAAPGDNILSSSPLPPYSRRLGGTSMATPHVAGLLALWAEASGNRGASLWQSLISAAVPLPHPASDVGAGLVQAP